LKSLLTKKYDNPILGFKWVQFDGDVSFVYIGFLNTTSIVCLEIHGDKFEKAVESVISVDFVYSSFLIIVSQNTRTVLAYNYELPNLFISTFNSKLPVEIPTSLRNAAYGCHSTSCTSDDGFLFSSAVKNSKAKSVSIGFGGTLMAKNSVRNYHVQAILRNAYIEFWLMAIPFPTFLTRSKLLPSTPDIIEIFLDLKQNLLIMMTEKSVIVCDFIKQSLVENVDEMMEQLDNTMAALDNDRKEIQKLRDTAPNKSRENVHTISKSTHSSLEPIPKSKSKGSFPTSADSVFKTKAGNPVLTMVKAFKKNAKKGKDKDVVGDVLDANTEQDEVTSSSEIPPDSQSIMEKATSPHEKAIEAVTSVIPVNPTLSPSRISSLRNTKILDSPPMYIADANWTVLFQVDLPAPVISYFSCSSQRMYAICTDNFLVVIHHDHTILFETKLSESPYYSDHEQLRANVLATKLGIFRISDRWCILVATTQSILLLEIEKRKVSPFAAFHCKNEFGTVLDIVNLGHDYSQNPIDEEKFVVLCTISSVLVFEVDQGRVSQSARRDFGFSISKAAVSRIEGK
jgi:hypothetical protein